MNSEERGAALVEFALALPLLLVVLAESWISA
jgi:Flp pilus assembly protein TadG